jgi:hypothetical protein
MGIDFPNTPSVGAQWPSPPVVGIPTYTWDGEKWTTVGGAISTGGSPATALPLMDATPALVGTTIKYAREDHVHPTDTTRAALVSPIFTGDPQAPTPVATDNDTSIATTAFVKGAIAALPAPPVAATAAEYISNLAPTKMLTPGAVWTAAQVLGLTDAATVTPDFSQGLDFLWNLGAAGRGLANPANPKKGQKGCILLVQNVANSTITSWGSTWKFPGGTKPTLSTAAGAVDCVSFWVYDPTFIVCSFQQGLA